MGGKYSEAQKNASKKWRLKNREKVSDYNAIYNVGKIQDPLYIKNYYQEHKEEYRFRREALRLRKILLD